MRHVHNYMIEKSQVNTLTNKKEKELSKISKCAKRQEKLFDNSLGIEIKQV